MLVGDKADTASRGLIGSLEFPPVRCGTSFTLTNFDSKNVVTDIWDLNYVIPESDVLSYLPVLQALKGDIKEVEVKVMGNFNVHSLRKLQRMHQLINLKARVKNEDEWFQNKENIEPPHNTCLPLDENASQECHQLLKTKSNGKIIFKPSTVVADIASICCNQWLSKNPLNKYHFLIHGFILAQIIRKRHH